MAGAGSTTAAETSCRPLTLRPTLRRGWPSPALASPRGPRGRLTGLRAQEPSAAAGNSRFASEPLSAQRCPARGFRAPPASRCLVRRGLSGTTNFSRWMSRSDLAVGPGGSGARASPPARGKDRAAETGISGRCWLRLSLGVFKTRAAAAVYSRRRHSTAAVGLGQVANRAGGRSALCHSRAGGWRTVSL